MSESVGKWNNAMNQIGLRGDLVRVTTGANITARYEGVAGADGITFIDGVNISQTGQCPVHGTVGDSIFSAQIYVAPRSDFFTQGSDRRALWEACPTQGGPAYTCSKQYDFGSVMIHELGHAIGFLHHPETVQMHDGSSGAVNLAKCANPLDQATMCAVLDDHRTHFRTLDAWDVESLRQVHLHF